MALVHAGALTRPSYTPPSLTKVFGATLLSLLSCACEATPDGTPLPPSDITLDSSDNYQVDIGLTIPVLPIDPANPLVDWSGVVDNLRGERITTESLTLLTLARFDGQTPTTITTRLETGQGVSDVATVAAKLVPTDATTRASLVDFDQTTPTSDGKVVVTDFFATSATYLLSFAKGSEQGQGTQALVFLEPLAGAPAPLLIPTGSGLLTTYAPTFQPPVEVPANQAPGVIGWGNVRNDGLGQVIGSGFDKINRVFLAFHAGKAITDFGLKDAFLRLEPDATKLWQADIPPPAVGQPAQRSIDLSQLRSRDGESFSQFDLAPGVWFFAAMCDNCNHPATIVTTLKPVGN